MDRSKKMPYSVQELVNLYDYTSSGHFFDKDTMKFFKSRVTDNFRRIDDKTAYFITTEKGPSDGSRRKATVRKATIINKKRADGDIVSEIEIDTVGDFNRMSLPIAKKYMQGLE